MKYIFCFLLISLSVFGQAEDRKPDYIYVENDVFIEVFEDQDSVRANERYYDDFKLHDDFYSYKDLKTFKDEWDVEEGDLIDYSLLKPISKNLLNKEIHFEKAIGNDMYFRFLKNNWVHVYTEKDGSFYRFNNSIHRYIIPDKYNGKVLMILEYDYITIFYKKDNLDWKTSEYFYSLWESAELLSNPYLIEIENNWEPPFESGYGFEIRKNKDKYGVYDLVLDKLVIDYLYDEIQLNRNVIVRNGDRYGLLDYYGKELMPLEFKVISYCDNQLQYLNKENTLYYKNYKGEIIQPEDVDYKNWIPSYEKENSNGRNSWKFIKKEDGFYLISKSYKNPNQSFEKRIKIQNWEQYDELVFASGESENDGGNIYQVVFAKKSSGKYDVFYHDANPDFSIVEKDLDSFSVQYLPYGFETNYCNFYILLHKGGLVRPLYFKKGSFKYTSLDLRFGDYYRFTLPNGQKGWVHTSGKEYYDDE